MSCESTFIFEIHETPTRTWNEARWVFAISHSKGCIRWNDEYTLTDVEFAALYGAVCSKISGAGLRHPSFETPVSDKYKVEPIIGDTYWRIRDTDLNRQAIFQSKQLAELNLWHVLLEPQYAERIFWCAIPGGAQ